MELRPGRGLRTALTFKIRATPVLHPSLAIVYRERASALYDALQQDASRARAADIIRSLVSEIILMPEDGVLRVELRGDLAGILTIAASRQRSSRPDGRTAALASQVMLVAGARNTRFLRLVESAIPRLAA
jgi:site-specific DNA recombinase